MVVGAMKAAIIILLMIDCSDATKLKRDDINEQLRKMNASKTMFELSTADLAMLDELNTIRKLIAQGFFNDPFKKLSKLALEQGEILLTNLGGEIKKIGEDIAAWGLKVWESVKTGWGGSGVHTDEDLKKIASATGNAIEKGRAALKKAASDPLSIFGKKRRKRSWFEGVKQIVHGIELAFQKPKNVFGPATNMNMLTWNRRLSQLAMIERKNIEKKDLTVIEYEGKKYRINKYGTLATYIITNILGEWIAKLFKYIRIGYLACKLWFDKVDIPNQSESDTIGKTHEMLFADRTEVGCFYTWPDTICIIGPIIATRGELYKNGTICADCKYGCTNHLCNPSPDYFFKTREKYKKYLRTKIEKFEIVENFDGQPPILGKNFMIDSANYSNVLMIAILMVSSFLLLCNKF